MEGLLCRSVHLTVSAQRSLGFQMHAPAKYLRILVLQDGRVAQLGERVLCKHEVAGSIPVTSTNFISFHKTEKIQER